MSLESTLESINGALIRIADALEAENALKGIGKPGKTHTAAEVAAVTESVQTDEVVEGQDNRSPAQRGAATRKANAAKKKAAMIEKQSEVNDIAQTEMQRQTSTAAPQTMPLVTEESFLPDDSIASVVEQAIPDESPWGSPPNQVATKLVFSDPATAKTDLHKLLGIISRKLGTQAGKLQAVLEMFNDDAGVPCKGLNALPAVHYEDMANAANELLPSEQRIQQSEL